MFIQIALYLAIIMPSKCFADDDSIGIVMLDQYTFYKVASKFHYALIKFDHPYPIGLDHEAFVSLGRQLSTTTDGNDILLANVQIDFDDPQHKDIVQRYKLDVAEFPKLKLFLNHDYRNATVQAFKKLRPVNYPTERDYNLDSRIVLNPITMRLFLWTQVNIRTPLTNCTQELDELAEEFVYILEQNESVQPLKELQDRVNQIYTNSPKGWTKYSASIYAKFMLKAIDQGLPYFDYEHLRIKKLLADHYHVTEERRKKLSAHFNILQSFRLRNYENMLKENENARIRNYNPARIEL